jgi:hypothetical protein
VGFRLGVRRAMPQALIKILRKGILKYTIKLVLL